jgi:hypothetical protein
MTKERKLFFKQQALVNEKKMKNLVGRNPGEPIPDP